MSEKTKKDLILEAHERGMTLLEAIDYSGACRRHVIAVLRKADLVLEGLYNKSEATRLKNLRRKKMPVRIRGVDYASAEEAAAALGVAKGTVYAAISAGTVDTVGMLRRNDRWNSIKVSLFGVEYPSAAAAARALGYKSRGPQFYKALRGDPKAMASVRARMMKHMAAQESAARKSKDKGL